MGTLSVQPAISVLPMHSIGQHYGHSDRVAGPTCERTVPARLIKFYPRDRIRTNVSKSSSFGASRSRLVFQPLHLISRRSTVSAVARVRSVAHRHGNNTVTRGAAELVNDYSHCKNNSIEGAVMGIMADVIQHCFKDECDGMREKVFDQMGSGLAALFRVSMGVAADSSPAPIPNRRDLADITVEDLEQVRRMLQLTSLPFHNTYDEDLKQLTNMLRAGEGQERRLTGDELSQIFARLGSDLVQCLGPLAMCFPKLPLYAKRRALLMPAEVVGRMAISLIANPNRR